MPNAINQTRAPRNARSGPLLNVFDISNTIAPLLHPAQSQGNAGFYGDRFQGGGIDEVGNYAGQVASRFGSVGQVAGGALSGISQAYGAIDDLYSYDPKFEGVTEAVQPRDQLPVYQLGDDAKAISDFKFDKGEANKAVGRSALGGVSAGASIGSVVPGIGTAIGAAVGGIAGLVGGLFGRRSAKRKARRAKKKAQMELAAATDAFNDRNVRYYEDLEAERKEAARRRNLQGQRLRLLYGY